MNTVHKMKSMLHARLDGWPDGTTIDQVMTDCAVIILSNMRPQEIQAALLMSLGHDGVAQIIAEQFGDSNGIEPTQETSLRPEGQGYVLDPRQPGLDRGETTHLRGSCGNG